MALRRIRQTRLDEKAVMASSEEYLNPVLGMLSDVEGISHRKMMGEYLIYLDGKVIGGIYDDEFLLKADDRLSVLLPDADKRYPYEGAKAMMVIVSIEDPSAVSELIESLRS